MSGKPIWNLHGQVTSRDASGKPTPSPQPVIDRGSCLWILRLSLCIFSMALGSTAKAGFLSQSSNGSDGAFAPVIDTVLPGGVYNFTSFQIPLGVTVTVTGAAPLQIFSQGVVNIAGILNLAGQDGETNINYIQSPATYGGAGGGGGGGAGGAGGWFSGSLFAGTPGQGPGGGGGAGTAGSYIPVGSGGGGGGHATVGQNGTLPIYSVGYVTTPAGVGGSAYGSLDPFTLEGGSGGGGGAHGAALNGVGGGGGGGGGAVLVWSDASIIVDGSILATGGDGGDVIGRDGGGGGGGSGGSIWLQAPHVLANGLVDALGGGGGSGTETAAGLRYGGFGGDGAPGFIRVDAYSFAGLTSPVAMVNLVPEPSAITLAALGILGLAGCHHRRSRLNRCRRDGGVK